MYTCIHMYTCTHIFVNKFDRALAFSRCYDVVPIAEPPFAHNPG